MKGPCRIPLKTVVLAFCAVLTGRVWAEAISTVSPFLPQNGTAGAVTENSPIELRGILVAPGGSLFGLYDPVKKQGGWAKLNEAGRDFTVRTYDAANDAVTVEYQGRVLTLALKTSKIESLPAMAMVAPMPPRPSPGGPPGGVVAAAPSVDDTKRLEAVAAEVARRRQLRQAAMQQPPQNPGQQGQSAPAQQPQPVRTGNGIGGNR